MINTLTIQPRHVAYEKSSQQLISKGDAYQILNSIASNDYEKLKLEKGDLDGAIVRWSRSQMCLICSLDIDQKTPGVRLTLDDVKDIFPSPAFAQETKSGGLHLIFLASMYFTALELASLARNAIAKNIPHSNIELIPTFRIYNLKPFPQLNVATFANIFYNYGTLKAKFETQKKAAKIIEGRHSHESCPFSPSPGKDNNPSVVVTPEYTYCHRCKRGVSHIN